ncbi:glycoside hydrolase superfamily [Pavlovales sp. CCMP2436]|nr:glycoside hydrolase superfamily [Pavlovales sp. CCMP2436]
MPHVLAVIAVATSALIITLLAVLVLDYRRGLGQVAELVPFKEAAPPDLLVGAAYNDMRLWALNSLAEEAAYDSLFERHFSLVAPENSCKIITIMPSRHGPYDFALCERALADLAGLEGLGDCNDLPDTNLTQTLAKGMLARGVPLEAIGLQFHVSGVRTVMIALTNLGLEVHVTELDLERKLQAEVFASVATVCLEFAKCTHAVNNQHTHQFDEAYAPKPATFAYSQALQAGRPV